MKKACGFTIVEVLIATVVLTVALVSILGLFTYSLALTESQESLTIAQYEAQRQLETIKADDYSTIRASYTDSGAIQENQFTLTDSTGMGAVYAEELPDSSNRLMRIKVVVCYQQKNRVIGEDRDLDGILDNGEDANGNGELDSPAQIETVIVDE